MRKAAPFVSLCIAIIVYGIPVCAAETCPAGEDNIDKVGGYGKAVKAFVKNAANCDTAYKALLSCQLGSSGDNALADMVQAKCEPLFIVKATWATKHAYKRAQSQCNKIALKNQGSMYQGFAAVCRAKAAWDFSRK